MTGEMNILPLPPATPATVRPQVGELLKLLTPVEGLIGAGQSAKAEVLSLKQADQTFQLLLKVTAGQRPSDHRAGDQQSAAAPRHQSGDHSALGGQSGDYRATSHCQQRRRPHPHRHRAIAGRHAAARQSADLAGAAANAGASGGVSLDGQPAQHRTERQHPDHRQPAAAAHRHFAVGIGRRLTHPEIPADEQPPGTTGRESATARPAKPSGFPGRGC